uniref:Transcription elongation factor GreA n=1 Tax=Lygus hesperus TaxID=30085 RepID=A0A0A9XP65_LYGHE
MDQNVRKMSQNNQQKSQNVRKMNQKYDQNNTYVRVGDSSYDNKRINISKPTTDAVDGAKITIPEAHTTPVNGPYSVEGYVSAPYSVEQRRQYLHIHRYDIPTAVWEGVLLQLNPEQRQPYTSEHGDQFIPHTPTPETKRR